MESRFSLTLPHPVVLLLTCILVAAISTWLLPAGEFERRADPETGAMLVIPGTYHAVEASPVGPLDTLLAVPRGIVEGASVVVVILIVGGAFALLDGTGALSRLIGTITCGGLGSKTIIAMVCLVFAFFGAIENMFEEIIALAPVLVRLSNRLGYGARTALGMSVGPAVVGAAFGPFNPFGAGLALRYAELPADSGLSIRLLVLFAAIALWIIWLLRHIRHDLHPDDVPRSELSVAGNKDYLMIALVVLPFIPYVYGVLYLDWGFDELSALFFLAAYLIGAIAGLTMTGTTVQFMKGMESMLGAAILVGVARGISVVLADGNVLDTIVYGLARPLENLPPLVSGILMVPVQSLIHLPVPSNSGQAVLVMPVFAPVADLLGLSRNVPVMAYQTGAIMLDLVTPTNGGLLAMLLAARVPFMDWVRFIIPGVLLTSLAGFAGILLFIL